MLPINTIRYGTDEFTFNKMGLITATPLDCTALTSVTGFTIAGNQPANTSRAVVFKVDGTYYKLSGAGSATLTAVATQSITADSVLAEGNSVADLTAITAIAGFVGKSVGVSIGLMAPGDTTDFPTLSLSINGSSSSSQAVLTSVSSVYSLASEAVEIIDLAAQVTALNGGSADVQVALQQNGVWTSFMPLVQAKRQKATALKYQASYNVATIGTGSAKVDKVTTLYRSNNAAVSGDIAEIISITEDFSGVGMRFGRLTVKHQVLKDASISAYMAMRATPKTRERIAIGTGNGSRQTLTLKPSGAPAADTGVNHNTLRIWHGSSEVFGFDFNTELSQISTSAADGVTVFASYSYGWEAEKWVEMTKGTTQAYDDPNVNSTEFTYTLASTDTAKGVAAVKIVLSKPGGTVTGAVLGTATGKTQMFVLPHIAKTASISVVASIGTATWTYDYDSRILTVAATKGATVSASYEWIAETPVCVGFVACWNE